MPALPPSPSNAVGPAQDEPSRAGRAADVPPPASPPPQRDDRRRRLHSPIGPRGWRRLGDVALLLSAVAVIALAVVVLQQQR